MSHAILRKKFEFHSLCSTGLITIKKWKFSYCSLQRCFRLSNICTIYATPRSGEKIFGPLFSPQWWLLQDDFCHYWIQNIAINSISSKFSDKEEHGRYWLKYISRAKAFHESFLSWEVLMREQINQKCSKASLYSRGCWSTANTDWKHIFALIFVWSE
jgi:hypothetical protein